VLSVIDEECELGELRSTPEKDTNGTAQPTASSTRQVLPDPRENSSRTEVQAVTLPQIVGVRYS